MFISCAAQSPALLQAAKPSRNITSFPRMPRWLCWSKGTMGSPGRLGPCTAPGHPTRPTRKRHTNACSSRVCRSCWPSLPGLHDGDWDLSCVLKHSNSLCDILGRLALRLSPCREEEEAFTRVRAHRLVGSVLPWQVSWLPYGKPMHSMSTTGLGSPHHPQSKIRAGRRGQC